jgi:hypothetical protein
VKAVVTLEITPEPSDAERAAIAAALAAGADKPSSAWPETVLPGRDDPEEA